MVAIEEAKKVDSTTPSTQPAPVDLGGCAMWAIENGTFFLGMVLMFSKTVDLMVAFAPATIFGFSGLEVFYGMGVGLLVEGAAFVMKLTLPRAKNTMDWLWNVFVVALPFIISALAQIFDSFQVRSTMQAQPAWIQIFISWFVPSIPSVIIGALIGKAIFSSMPKELMPKPQSKQASPEESYVEDSPTRHKPLGMVGRFLSPKFRRNKASLSLPEIEAHAPALCASCQSVLPFIEYGTKPGKNGKIAKWPIYEKCKNDRCSVGRKNLGLPRNLIGGPQ